MPRHYRKKSGKRPYRRKSYAKKKSFKKRRLARPLANPNGFPLSGSGLVHLQFSTQATITGTGTNLAERYYRLNSIWDPDFSAGGQPMYHDQLQVLYNHYHVLGTKVSIRCCGVGNNASTEYPIIVAFAIRDDNTTPTAIQQEVENGRCKTLLVTSAEKPQFLVSTWSARKFFGKDRADDESTSAAFGANPADMAWGILMIKSQNASASTPAVYFDIKMEFIVRPGEPKKLARS